MGDLVVTFGRPDFTICGMERPEGGVRLIASKTLSYVELRADYRRQDIFWEPRDIMPVASVLTSYDLILSTHMANFIVIDAPDYPSAFEELFRKWRPERDERTGIDQGHPAIEPPNKAIER